MTSPASTQQRPVRALTNAVMAAFAIASFYLSPTLGLPSGGVELGFVALPVIAIVFSARAIGTRAPARTVLAVAATYLTIVLATALFGGDRAQSLVSIVAGASVAVVFVLAGALLDRHDLRRIARCLVAVAAVQAVVAILEVQVQVPFIQQLAISPDYGRYLARDNLVLSGYLRASGTMGHPILLGVVCALGVLLVVTCQLVERRWVQVGLVALMSWGLLLSGSRSAVAALVLAVAVFLLRPEATGRRVPRKLLLVVAAVAGWFYITKTLQSAEVLSPYSLSNRVDAWSRVQEAFDRTGTALWLGEGGLFSTETVADNQFLTTTGQYGVLGLAVLLVAVGFILLARSPHVAACGAFLTVLFLSFDVLAFSFTAMLFWLLVGASRTLTGNPAISSASGSLLPTAGTRKRPAPTA